MFFIIDIVLNFFSAYYTDDMEIIDDRNVKHTFVFHFIRISLEYIWKAGLSSIWYLLFRSSLYSHLVAA